MSTRFAWPLPLVVHRGLCIANPETGQSAIREAIAVARSAGTRIALTCSDSFVPEVFGDVFHESLRQSDLLFCNASESLAVTGAASPQAAFERLGELVPHCVVTDGPQGAYVRFEGVAGHVPTTPCEPRDLTGAGDMFAGAFLYGITHGYDPLVAARAANAMSRRVIGQVGARLHDGVRSTWAEASGQ